VIDCEHINALDSGLSTPASETLPIAMSPATTAWQLSNGKSLFRPGGLGQGIRTEAHNRPAESLMRSPVCRQATVLRMTDHRRSPDVIGRVRGPADPGKWLPAIVIGGTLAGKTTPRPPVHQPTAVRTPAADGGEPCEEVIPRWRATRLRRPSLVYREQSGNECSDPHLASHKSFSPLEGPLSATAGRTEGEEDYLGSAAAFGAGNCSEPEAAGAGAGAGREVDGPPT
jgi:hypothetical protein